MRLNFPHLLMTGLLVLPAYSPNGGGGTPPDSLQLAGKYNGSFVIANSSPFVDVKTTFTVDAAGTSAARPRQRMRRKPIRERSRGRFRAILR